MVILDIIFDANLTRCAASMAGGWRQLRPSGQVFRWGPTGGPTLVSAYVTHNSSLFCPPPVFSTFILSSQRHSHIPSTQNLFLSLSIYVQQTAKLNVSNFANKSESDPLTTHNSREQDTAGVQPLNTLRYHAAT